MDTMTCAPDLILHNARVYTVNEKQPWAQAIAIRKHRIMAVGTDAEILPLADGATQIRDLGGKLVLPGFCDAHIHLLNYCLGLRLVGLAGTRSRAEMLQRMAARAAVTAPGDWIVGQGWNESFWGETDFPTAQDLDPVTGRDKPALCYRSDMHGAVANTAALHRAGVTAATPNPPGGVIDRDAHGQPTGVLRELAIDLVASHIPEATLAERETALLAGMRELHKVGVTAVHAQRIKDNPDGPQEWSALLSLREKGQLQIRIACNIAAHDLPHLVGLGLRTGFGDDTLRLGHVKVFSDGSLGSRTAWLLEPFVKLSAREPDNLGVNVTPPEQMAREFRMATLAGFPISVHAIGDHANRVVLDIFEELADAGLKPPIPHRIEHVQIIAPADLPRLARLKITASVQPLHATDDMDTADRFLGPRGAHMYNFRSLLAHGVLVAFGSDAPVADTNPFLGIHAALTRQRPDRMDAAPWYPDERIGLAESIYAYTLGAARAVGWESEIGSLEAGKRADLIVVDRDLFALEQAGLRGSEIADTRVLLTLFNGVVVHAVDGR